ncbi:hypothetical protein BJX70DRAFT_394585 [Aspergillus crustosus]
MPVKSRASLACENCRRRRIKCNQIRPRCSQCARAGLSCSGYRAPLDLLFQDESATVARKFRKEPQSNSPTLSPENTNAPETISPLQFLSQSQSQPHTQDQSHSSLSFIIPSTKIEDFAWTYYLTNFNITRHNPGCYPDPYLTASTTGMASVTSVGLAALALIHHDPHMMELARKNYSAALRNLARAVRDPKELRKGTTATASFNLSMFEMIISDSPEAAYSWLRHIHGTAALMRVVHMPTNGDASAITGCLQVSFSVAIGCLISEQPVPRDVIRLVKSLRREAEDEGEEINSYIDIDIDIAAIVELFTLLSSLVNLYVQIKKSHSQSGDKSPSSTETDLNMTSALAEIDADLLHWESRLPPLWTGAPHTGRAIISHNRDESGGTHWIPRLWGYYRLCRILTHSIILDDNRNNNNNTQKGLSPIELKNSRKIIRQMCAGIYASVPAMLKKSFFFSCFEPCLGLTSDVFFLVTILQALVKVTVAAAAAAAEDVEDVVGNWACPASEVLGGKFGPLRGFVGKFLC